MTILGLYGSTLRSATVFEGKLLSKIKNSNGDYKDKEIEMGRLLKELELLYKQISMSEKVDEKQIREVLSYKEKFVQFLVFEEDL